MKRIEDPLTMQARRRSDHRFEYDHAGSMRENPYLLCHQKSFGRFLLWSRMFGKIMHTNGITDKNINLVKTRI